MPSLCGASSSPFVKTIILNIDFWSLARFFSGASFHRGQRRVADIMKGSVPMRRVFILYFCLALRRGRGASLAAPQPCPAGRGARAAATNSGRCGRGPALAGKGGRPTQGGAKQLLHGVPKRELVDPPAGPGRVFEVVQSLLEPSMGHLPLT